MAKRGVAGYWLELYVDSSDDAVNELDAVLAAWEDCCRRDQPAVLATVVKVTGSAYRRPGARMIFPVGAPPAVTSVGGGERTSAGPGPEPGKRSSMAGGGVTNPGGGRKSWGGSEGPTIA